MNFVGPLGPRWRKSKMAAMKYFAAGNMIIHIIVSTLVVPPNVNPHNKCIWTRAYYLLQDIEQPMRWKSLTVQIDGVEQDDAESSDKTPCTNSDLKAAESHYDELMAMAKDVEEVADDEAIARIQAIRDSNVETLAKDPTASLWIQYLDMIQILRKFIRAERLGNWYLHLEAVSEMLPYLAASGQSLYTKTASIDLSSTANLPNDHRVVHQHFVEGLHVAKRSDRA